ncbi:MAG TPA: histidine kinase dimerization/phospho-acceptor domain-containing protein, partial [Planctomycetota bacterium]|nr:histidine kinase dimerization/phospho-acceptor domain-containing protein [Planctomycetota bacterium]
MLLIVVTLNLLVLGAVQLAQTLTFERWRSNARAVYEDYLGGILREAYGAEQRAPLATVRNLLTLDPFRGVFKDVMVSNGRSPQAPGFVDLNPLGAALRDHRTFPLQDVREGIQRAIRERALIPVGDGYCVPISSGERVVAGAWFAPHLPPPPQLRLWVLAASLVVGTLATVLFARWAIDRAVARPLRDLAAAAARVGAGEPDVSVPSLPPSHELAALIADFNAMARRVAGHTQELDAAVKRATEEAARKERALVLSGRLAAVGTLAAGIAHEINNPIGGMMNATRRLLERPDLSERDRRYLELIREGLERVGKIARRVLDFSPRQVQATDFPIAQAIDGARALLDHRLAREGIEFTVDLAPDLPPVHGDPHEMQQVLLNVFLNSCDVLSGRSAPRRIAVTGRLRGDQVEIVVADNGPGMPRAELQRVFDPFFSA